MIWAFVQNWLTRRSNTGRKAVAMQGDPDVESAVARLLVLGNCGFPFAVRLAEPYS